MEYASRLLENSNQKILEIMETKLRDREDALNAAATDKQNLGVSMHRLQQEFLKLQLALEETQKNSHEISKSNSDLKGQNKGANGKLSIIEKQNMELNKKVELLSSQAEKHKEDLECTRIAAKSLKMNLNSHKMTEATNAKDIDRLESSIGMMEKEKSQLHLTLSKSDKKYEDLQRKLTAQEHETKLAQLELNKLAEEMQSLIASKTLVQQQWQKSIVAMTKRDDALEKAHRKQQETESQIALVNNSKNGVATMVATYEQQLQLRNQELAGIQEKLLGVENEVKALLQSKLEMEKIAGKREATLRKSESVISETSNLIVHKQKLLENANNESNEYKNRVNELQIQIQTLTSENEILKNTSNHQQSGLEYENKRLLKKVNELEALSKNSESRARKSFLEQKIEYSNLRKTHQKEQEGLESLQREKQILLEKLTTSEAVVLRQEHQLNKLKNVPKTSLAVSGSGKNDIERAKIVKQLKEEKSILTQEWSRAEDELIRSHQTAAHMKSLTSNTLQELSFVSKVHTAEVSRSSKLQRQVEKKSIEIDLLRASRCKDSQHSKELEVGNQKLAVDLHTAMMGAKMDRLNGSTENAILKSTIQSEKRRRRDMFDMNLNAQSNISAMHGRFDVMQSKFQAAKVHSDTIQIELDSMRMKLHESTKQISSLKKDVALKNVMLDKLSSRLQDLKPGHSTPQLEDDVSKRLVYQAESRRTKAQLEATQVRNMYDKEKDKCERLGRGFLERDQHARELLDQVQSLEASIKVLQSRYDQAVRAACNLERQLKRDSIEYLHMDHCDDRLMCISPQLAKDLDFKTNTSEL